MDPLSQGIEEESDEIDFDYYLSQISPQPTGNSTEAQPKPSTADTTSDALNACCVQPLSGLSLTQGDDDNVTETDVKDLFVVVDNPEKHTTAMESYITFRVTSKTTRSDYESSEFQVRRRYNDFIWLRQRLEETQPTLLVPPLPEKHSLKRFDRFNQEFVHMRMRALHIFMSRLAEHPVLSFNKNFQTFLTAKQSEFQAAKKEGTGFMSRMADSFHNMSASYMMKNRPPEFVATTEYINGFSDKLAVLDRISQRVIKEQYDYLSELNEWGPVFTLWSNNEGKLNDALVAMAKAVEKCFLSLQQLADATEHSLSNPLREYMLYAEAIKVVLRRRDAIQMEYEMTVEELNRKKDEKDQLNKQVETLNDRATCSNADLKADLDRWHKTKRRDFRKVFSEMADRNIQYYQQCLAAWEEAIPLIQKTDATHDDLPHDLHQ
ncbi:hypothetical protein CAPTEDRAFT_21975 [Capitella teleta]|uniref:PX domain-containing protein n=1 Tax=Capitella teleta TaxID=283909 RepID=R7UKX8_CAPTE|nr:hypothetical protein CAPTEDRAFT_21975 [Capitella teleta]|eukprot:ELU06895.1 hypothetical protein CAPTEDRAFT_21975 [Capitella teleta]